MDETAQINVYHSLSSLMLTKRVYGICYAL